MNGLKCVQSSDSMHAACAQHRLTPSLPCLFLGSFVSVLFGANLTDTRSQALLASS